MYTDKTAAGLAHSFADAFSKGDLSAVATMVLGGQASPQAEKLGKLLAVNSRLTVRVEKVTESEVIFGVYTDKKLCEEAFSITGAGDGWRLLPEIYSPGAADAFLRPIVAGLLHPLRLEPIISQLGQRVRSNEEALQMRDLATGMHMYLEDHDDRFPGADLDLCEELDPYVRNNAALNRLRRRDDIQWKLHQGLRGFTATAVASPSETPMFYIEQSGRLWVEDGNSLVCMVDGSVRVVPADKFASLDWIGEAPVV